MIHLLMPLMLILLVSACGKTGDLYLPDVAKPTTAEKVSVESQAQNKEDK